MCEIFGTHGVRGIANSELTSGLVFRLGQAGAVAIGKNKSGAVRILIAKDTRASGDMLEAAISAGICSVGAQAVCVGIIPAPALAYLVRKYKMDGGVVISASHNEAEYNGIKFYDSDGYVLDRETEAIMEMYVSGKEDISVFLKSGIQLGRISRTHTGLRDYVDYVKSVTNADFSGLKIAIDCANGAAYQCAKLVFKELGADVEMINNVPDGANINKNCGPTNIDCISNFTVLHKCNVGFALDGDADRVIAVDEEGNVIDGDGIMAVCVSDMKESGKLSESKIAVTVMSNSGFLKTMEAIGVECMIAPVGDRYVLESMLENGCEIGGEQSGHIIFGKYNTTGDGLITAVKFAECFVKSNASHVSELVSFVVKVPQVFADASVKKGKQKNFMEDFEIKHAVEELKEKAEKNGWRILVRPAETESVVRIMAEGENPEDIRADVKNLAALIERRLG